MDMKFAPPAVPISLVLLAGAAVMAQKTVQPGAEPDWILTFADEFDGPDLDLTKWAPHETSGREHNRPFQAYIPDAARVSGGQLHLEMNGDGPSVVTTFGTFAQSFGRFEIRCRAVPAGSLRQAFRLRPRSYRALPEIDVFELTPAVPPKILFANRWGTEQTERSFGDAFAAPDFSTGFHTIATDWDASGIRWTVDGKERFKSVDGVPNEAMYLQLELARVDRLLHASDDSAGVPASFDIDYVHVYKHR
jgi:beta-glucanase (GH16 family)